MARTETGTAARERERVTGLRTIAVTGPRIDPASLPQVERTRERTFVPSDPGGAARAAGLIAQLF